jgi:hypothetical protein
MVSPTKSPTTKDLILHSNNEQSYIEVSSHHTLSNVCLLILDEFDIEQLPDGKTQEFAFRINKIRISEKQEGKKRAFDLIERGVKLELVAKRGVKRLLDEEGLEEEEEEEEKKKRAKNEEEGGFVTPYEKDDKDNSEKEQDDVAEKEVGENKMMPLDLDDKFAEKKDEEEDYFSSSESTIPLDEGADGDAIDEMAEAADERVGDSEGKTADAEEEVFFDTDTDDDEMAEAANEKILDDSKAKALSENAVNMEDEMTFGAGGDSDKENDTLERNDNNTVDIDAIEKASESTTKASGTTANEAKRKGKSTEEENGEEQNPHKEADEAKDILSELKKILQANPDFCTVDRKNAL